MKQGNIKNTQNKIINMQRDLNLNRFIVILIYTVSVKYNFITNYINYWGEKYE